MGAQWKHKGRTENAAAKGRVFSKLAKECAVYLEWLPEAVSSISEEPAALSHPSLSLASISAASPAAPSRLHTATMTMI
jgi:hypothetical protein